MDVRPIDANELLQRRRNFGKPYALDPIDKNIDDQLVDLRHVLKAPTLDYAPVRHGEWIDEINPNAVTASGREVHVWRCSSCGFTWANKHDVLHYFKHCPNCGAKMDGGKKDDVSEKG